MHEMIAMGIIGLGSALLVGTVGLVFYIPKLLFNLWKRK